MIGKKWWLVPALAVAFAGCKPSEEIRTYTVEKEPEKAARPEAAPAGESKVRLLGSIIPASTRDNWFVRFLGPIDQVSPLEEDFNKFLASIRVGEGDPKALTWAVPSGWTVAPPKKLRIVTLQKGPAEFYISDPIGGSILDNVNSWRADFVGIGKVTEAGLPEVTTEMVLGTTKAIRVDFRGPGGKGRMGSGPFSGKN